MKWLDALSAAGRFGAAVRLQDSGRLEEAKRHLLELSKWFEARELRDSPQLMSTRLMGLVHLAEVAKTLGDASVAEKALSQWLSEWQRLTDRAPELRSVEVLAKWEVWVKASLEQMEKEKEEDLVTP
jgi:adenylylsulfate kinase-like enzyme